jgi:RNA polymerase sigma factor (sigma-70 family)
VKDPSKDNGVSAPTDTDIMRAVRDGEPQKLAVLFERHHIPLYNYYVRMTKDRDLSEDLVQDVFLRILKYRHSFRGEGEFSTWLYHIARNVRIDHARRWNSEVPMKDGCENHPDEAPHVGAIEHKENVSILNAALSMLPPEKREIIILSRYQNLKYAAIGELLGCSVEAVKVRVHRAVNELRTIFFELSGEPEQ